MRDVGDGSGVVFQAADRDHVEGTVGLAVTAAMESHSLGLAGTDRYGSDAAESGERRVGVESVNVLPSGDEQLGGVPGSDPDQRDQTGCGCSNEGFELGVQVPDLFIERRDAPGKAAQRELRGL